MADTNEANRVSDRNSVDVWTDHILRVPILLTKNIGIVSGSMIFAFFAMAISWSHKAQEYGWNVGLLACYVLGAILGYRAYQESVSRPIGAAFGVA